MRQLMQKANFIIDKICDFFDTPYFALVVGVIELLFYYLGIDLVTIVVISLVTSFAFLFKKNLNSILVIFLFMSSMISLKNSPANNDVSGNATYYFQPSVYITCIVFAAIPVAIVTFRAVKNIVQRKIKYDTFILMTFLLGLSFLLNGVLREEYNPLDTMFGVFMFFFFVVFFIAIIPSVSINKESLLKISRQVEIYLLVPFVELVVYYITYFARGNIFDYRLYILLGWGNRNTIGMLFTVMFPFILFLTQYETKKILKVLSFVFGTLLLCATVLTFSRQAYLFMFVLITFYLVFLLYKSDGLSKIRYRGLLFAWCGGIAIILFACEISGFFESIGMNGMSYSRIDLWRDSIESFRKNPFFGGGFFFLGGDPKVQLNSVMPYCCHNTIFEMFGACGLFGGVSYLCYRGLSIRKICRNLTIEKAYPFMACSSIVLMSLLDIHVFDFFGSALYIILLCMSLASKTTDEEEVAENKELITESN